MTILEAENQTLRQRLREMEAELQSFKDTCARLVEENEELQNRIKVLERQLHADTDGRIHERVEVTFRVDGASIRGEAAMGLARNISAGGAFIETDLHLRPNELMTMTFELLGRPFKIQAEVVHVTPAGFGVRFSADPQQQAVLRDMVSRL